MGLGEFRVAPEIARLDEVWGSDVLPYRYSFECRVEAVYRLYLRLPKWQPGFRIAP